MRGVSVEVLPVVEEAVQRNIFLYEFDMLEGEYAGEQAQSSIGRFDETIKLLRFNIIYNLFEKHRVNVPTAMLFFLRSDQILRDKMAIC